MINRDAATEELTELWGWLGSEAAETILDVVERHYSPRRLARAMYLAHEGFDIDGGEWEEADWFSRACDVLSRRAS